MQGVNCLCKSYRIHGTVGVAVEVIHDFQNPGVAESLQRLCGRPVIYRLFAPNEARTLQSLEPRLGSLSGRQDCFQSKTTAFRVHIRSYMPYIACFLVIDQKRITFTSWQSRQASARVLCASRTEPQRMVSLNKRTPRLPIIKSQFILCVVTIADS